MKESCLAAVLRSLKSLPSQSSRKTAGSLIIHHLLTPSCASYARSGLKRIENTRCAKEHLPFFLLLCQKVVLQAACWAALVPSFWGRAALQHGRLGCARRGYSKNLTIHTAFQSIQTYPYLIRMGDCFYFLMVLMKMNFVFLFDPQIISM